MSKFTSGSFTEIARLFLQREFAKDFLVFEVGSHLQCVRQIDPWAHPHGPRRGGKWPAATVLGRESCSDGVVQCDLERLIPMTRQRLELLSDIRVEGDCCASGRHASIIAAISMQSRCFASLTAQT